jgi:HD-GYP domain-containing protein (c-di-GMP phosphodiesterase class II)
MISPALLRNTNKTGIRPLPLVVTFDGDDVARRAVAHMQRFRRVTFDMLDQQDPEVERVVVLTREYQIEENYSKLRRPNFRVVALADKRFTEPRNDGAVYAYLPAETPGNLLERMIDNAIDHIQLIRNRSEINERLIGTTREIHELNLIGAALSAEHDPGKLLEMILTKSRQITWSDAGSLYLVEEVHDAAAGAQEPGQASHADGSALVKARVDGPKAVKKQLRFKLAQNDSVSIPFKEMTMEISDHSIAGYVAMTGEHVEIEDAYHLPPEVPYTINRKFDEDSGYRTKSILAVPMKNQRGDVVGVIQLLNAKSDMQAKLTNLKAVTEYVVPYTVRQHHILESVASQAAVALENSQLYEAIQRLFEGFVRASVIAIEARDPTTSGHSFRVANLTVALAEAVDRADTPAFRDIHFTRNEMKEIRYASLLHDFGKVGVREEVLVKAKKLYPAQLDIIRQRFHYVKRSMQAEVLQSRLDYVLQKGREEYLAKQGDFDAELADSWKQVDDYFATVLRSDEPSVLPEGNFERLTEIAARRFMDMEGGEQALLTDDEVRLLSIRKGSLDDAERQQIESHVVHTFNFLQQIPWTKEIKAIPAIARGHHEKLNGLGYPYKLSAPEIPVQTRMMTISDIFDALSASDRPYKKAVSLERALEILGFAVKDGEVDGTLFDLFREGKVFEKWKIEPYPY